MDSTIGPATLFPPGVVEASTWDPTLVAEVGRAIGEEAKNKGTGVQIMLGPDINIHRSPLGGRDGESFTEDPFLNSQLAVAYIDGLQSTGVGACAKHYICNNEEQDRGSVDVHVDQRALHEIYLPAFEASVTKAHVWSVMDAYNQVNGQYMTANRFLNSNILKKSCGWDGMIMSDWGAVHETPGAINSGDDLEMPGPGWLVPDKVASALAAGQVTQTQIDDNVHRIVRTIIRTGLLDGSMHPDHSVVGSEAHTQLAYKVAADGIILLKNDEAILPLDATKIHSIALIGRAKSMQMGAYGSPGVDPIHSITAYEAIQEKAGQSITLNFTYGDSSGDLVPANVVIPDQSSTGQQGWSAQYFANQNLQGEPALTRIDPIINFNWPTQGPGNGIPQTHFSARWSGSLTAPQTGLYTFRVQSDDGLRLFINDKPVIDSWQDQNDVHTVQFAMNAGQPYHVRIEYYQNEGGASISLKWSLPQSVVFHDAVTLAKQSDIAILFVGANHEGEGEDRPSTDLPDNQDELIEEVAAANPNTIVVLNNGTPVRMANWIGKVRGVVEAWFPGEEGGAALADILFGDVNPSGKLPDTFGVNREDYPDFGNFPGTNGVVNYAEGIYVGYRHFDKAHISPQFPFGFGLSYTTFRYSHLTLSTSNLTPSVQVIASVNITNTGSREGSEVLELYIRDTDPKVDKPVRELKGFKKVDLLPGQTKTVSMPVDAKSLAYCDVASAQWKADRGIYEVEIGASSRDIRLSAPLRLVSDYTEPIPDLQPNK